MDALSAFLRHVKLESLIEVAPTPKDAIKALTDAPVAPTNATAASQSHANATSADPSRIAAQSHATRALMNAEKQSAVLPTATGASSYTKLSADASLLGHLIHAAQSSVADLPDQLPLNVAANGAPQVAQTLNQSLSQSGLFYESHLRQWAAGERSLESLRREPHNRLPAAAMASSIHGKASAADMSAMPGGTNAAASLAGESAAQGLQNLPETLYPVVREQLDALDFQRVLWQGEVWPKQQAELEIREQPAQAGQESDTDAGEGRSWHSSLRIELPGLGTVVAQVLLTEEGAHVSVRASEQAAAALNQSGDSFREGMAAAGIVLRQLDIGEPRDDE